MGAPAAILARDFMTLPGIPPPTTPATTAVALVVGQELAAVILDDVHDVIGLGLTQTLDLDVVLVTPEVRHGDGGRQVLAEHGGHHAPRLVGDVAPMFNAHLVSKGVAPRRNIADRPHMGCAGTATVVAHDAVVDFECRCR